MHGSNKGVTGMKAFKISILLISLSTSLAYAEKGRDAEGGRDGSQPDRLDFQIVCEAASNEKGIGYQFIIGFPTTSFPESTLYPIAMYRYDQAEKNKCVRLKEFDDDG